MNNSIITQLYGVNPDEFRESILAVFKQEIQTLKEDFKPPTLSEYLTRKEVSAILKVSEVTLIDWDKKGIIKPYRLGNLIRYKSNELEQALIRIKKTNQ